MFLQLKTNLAVAVGLAAALFAVIVGGFEIVWWLAGSMTPLQARIAVVVASLVAAVLVAFGWLMFMRSVKRRLQILQDGAARLAQGEVGHQIETHGDDELAQAARSFNQMSRQLEFYYQERRRAEDDLNRLNQDLESRVGMRTQQLVDAYERLEHQVLHDALTKLPNRTLFVDRLEQAILTGQRDDRPFALMVMDLNGFKEINDSLGHHTGDLVLQELGVRLTKGLRRSDTVARLGGDEFAFILPLVRDRTSAIHAAEKVRDLVTQPISVDQQELHVGASVGIAMYPQNGATADTLLRHADIAMYDAKRRNAGFTLFTADLVLESANALNLQVELRTAIQRNELVLHYQPKVDMASSMVNGVEALVRWQHPQHGLLMPNDFLFMAERSGLIKPLTTWVLDMALKQLRVWHDAGKRLSLAVNISTINLHDPDFPSSVAAALAQHGIGAEYLELEVAETGLMVRPRLAIEGMNRLAEIGARVVIDDFGTGYTSLAYIKKLPVVKIKVDRSLVRNMLEDANNAVIVRSIIGLGHNLGLNVVAEGVESSQIWDQLRSLSCDSAQGYALSRAVPADELDRWFTGAPYSLPAPIG